MEAVVGNDGNNGALPLAGGEAQALHLRRDLPRMLFRVGAGTAATAAAGLATAVMGTASTHGQQAQDVPLAVVFILVVILFASFGVIFLGHRLQPEHAPNPLLRGAGVVAFLGCLLMLIVAVILVGSVDYVELTLKFIDN